MGVEDPGVVPLRHVVVVIDVEGPTVRVNSFLPTFKNIKKMLLIYGFWSLSTTFEEGGFFCCSWGWRLNHQIKLNLSNSRCPPKQHKVNWVV